MEILLLGTLIPEEFEKDYIKRGIRPAPADIAQKYMLQGIKKANENIKALAICSARIPFFPKTKMIRTKSKIWDLNGVTVHTVGYNNLPAVNFVDRQNRIIQAVKAWASQSSSDTRIIISYSIHSPFLKAAKLAKDIDPHIISVLVVPDLPEYMGNYGIVKRTLKKIDRGRIDGLLPYVDKYVLYSKYMAAELHLNEHQWIVMEGLFNTEKIKPDISTEPEHNLCIYAGSLNPKYAIDKLIRAFEMANIDAKLELYGDLKDVGIVSELLNNCKKTRYRGLLPSKEMYERLQQATLLINPRPSDLALARFSCPSKTFEYMASGRPVLMTRLPGVPDEYYDYVLTFEDETLEGFKKKLEAVFNMNTEELEKIGKKAQRFIYENKGIQQQMSRVIDFALE